LDTTSVFSTGRLESLVREFAAIGADPGGGVSRLAFSVEDLMARSRIKEIMSQDLGLDVRVDPWANIIGRRPGLDPEAPVIMTGSHLDTVRQGGWFDGAAGVLGAVEVFRALNALGVRTKHPLELVVFTAEEPNDFGLSTIGSRGMAGRLRPEDIKGVRDANGQELLDSLIRFGGDPDRVQGAERHPPNIKAFVEIHNEQMDHLERSGKDIGIVRGVTGIQRIRLTIRGQSGHSGTTPMHERRDALVAAASVITKVHALARKERGRAVATVGHIFVSPNSINIIPGQVVLDLEIRSFSVSAIRRIEAGLQTHIEKVEKRYGVRLASETTYSIEPTIFSKDVRRAISKACRKLGFSSMEIVSMAGHDANHMAGITRAGMIFVPSKKGLSHCPEEWTDPAQLIRGAEVLFHCLLELDKD